MSLKRVEIESLAKSFVLFFLSMNLLTAAIFYFVYENAQKNLDTSLLLEMKLCSFNLQCDRFSIDFEPLETKSLYTLEAEPEGRFALFPVPGSDRYAMKFTFGAEDYERELGGIRNTLYWQYFGVAAVLVLLSLLFSVYALHPLRRALKLTEEFVKDILHDVNTPLSALRLNISMLKRDVGESAKVSRMEEGIERIIALQGNLKSYLSNHALQAEAIELEALLASRKAWFEKLYPDIVFSLEAAPLTLRANTEALTRVIDNLLDNAAKYNVRGGSVAMIFDATTRELRIADSGRGIKEPSRVFERFYKEHERGMGIGLHIVKKLCDEMGIVIGLTSEKGVGTTFVLHFGALTER